MRAGRLRGLARSLVMYHGIPLRARRMRAFYSEFVAPGELCIDIGAHAGNRVRAWRALGARVVAVEPQPDFVRLLSLAFGRDSNVSIVPAAVGDRVGTATLSISLATPTVSTLSREWIEAVRQSDDFAGVEWSDEVDVDMTTLDELIAEHGEPCFVKIDVEGFEAAVLRGLSSPLPTLSFEYLAAALDVALQCIDRLETLGRYRYNLSHGETLELTEREWLTRSGIEARLAALADRGGSGDVYARLEDADHGRADL